MKITDEQREALAANADKVRRHARLARTGFGPLVDDEDKVQDTFLNLCRKLVREGESADALDVIEDRATSYAMSSRRDQARRTIDGHLGPSGRRNVQLDSVDFEHLAADPEPIRFEVDNMTSYLLGCLRRFGDDSIVAVAEHLMAGRTWKEAAEAAGLNKSTARTRFDRAAWFTRRLLESQGLTRDDLTC
jgi:DNA-directed RNA polymerase specialized sigma24 family protein